MGGRGCRSREVGEGLALCEVDGRKCATKCTAAQILETSVRSLRLVHCFLMMQRRFVRGLINAEMHRLCLQTLKDANKPLSLPSTSATAEGTRNIQWGIAQILGARACKRSGVRIPVSPPTTRYGNRWLRSTMMVVGFGTQNLGSIPSGATFSALVLQSRGFCA